MPGFAGTKMDENDLLEPRYRSRGQRFAVGGATCGAKVKRPAT